MKIELTPNEINYLLLLLSEQKWKESNDIIKKIHKQCNGINDEKKKGGVVPVK